VSQRAVLGPHTRSVIAVVREHGTRVEILALAPWVVPQALDHIAYYWLGEFAPHSTPQTSVLGMFA
jgi:hypothetical protein